MDPAPLFWPISRMVWANAPPRPKCFRSTECRVHVAEVRIVQERAAPVRRQRERPLVFRPVLALLDLLVQAAADAVAEGALHGLVGVVRLVVDVDLPPRAAGVRAPFGKLVLQNEDERFLVDPADIRYFEASQGKTCAVTDTDRYESKEKLYELAAALTSKGFIQINKSTVVNINYVRSIAAEFSGNYSARLKDSDETLTISRKYFQTFKEFVRR